MKTSLTILVRALGTLYGFMGVGSFLSMLMYVFSGGEDTAGGVILFSMVLMIGSMGGYLAYVCYLSWCRFSPLAVRHVIVVSYFLFWSILGKQVDFDLVQESFPLLFSGASLTGIFARDILYSLTGIFVIYFLYSLTARYMIKALFETVSASEPEPASP